MDDLKSILIWVALLTFPVSASSQGFTPVPDTPPKASLITISAPDASNFVRIQGEDGSVPGNSVIGLINLDAGNFSRAQANINGAFAVSMFAPLSSSILLKVDTTGATMLKVASDPAQHADPSFLAALPGTIIRVREPALTTGSTFGASVPFSASGQTTYNTPVQHPIWTFQGTINSAVVQPGGTLRVTGTPGYWVREAPGLEGWGLEGRGVEGPGGFRAVAG